jgi:hypothetical protein
MCEKHESKACPRCGASFACKPSNITQCQCYGIALPDSTKAWIAERYQDCLCANCLHTLQQQYQVFQDKFFPQNSR